MPRNEKPRLWKDEEILGMNETMIYLRRMRSAATQSRTVGYYAKKIGMRLLGIVQPEHSPQEALSDAKEFADSAGDFFAARISKTEVGKHEFQRWQDLLSHARKEYWIHSMSTYARTRMVDAVGQTVIGRLRNLRIDPDYMMCWDFTVGNNLGVRSVQELLKRDIGIASPLSGDYLAATTYRSYLQRVIGKTFALTPVALSSDLSHVELLEDEHRNPPLADKDEIGFFLDATETGNTGKKLFSYFQMLYPEIKLHKPLSEKVEFTQSKKMKRYWK